MGCGGPSRFPTWALSVGALHAAGVEVRVGCTGCGRWARVDLAALIERVGPGYSLIDRRCRCRIISGCAGWNRFYYDHAVMRPMWTEAAARRWMLEPKRAGEDEQISPKPAENCEE